MNTFAHFLRSIFVTPILVVAALLCGCHEGNMLAPEAPKLIVDPPFVPGSISFSTSALTFQSQSIYVARPASQDIVATISGVTTPGITLYLLVDVGNPALVSVSNVSITGPTTGQATVVPAPTASVGIGTHTTTITVRACIDPTCSGQQLQGSPKTINVTYTVLSNVRNDTVTPNIVPSGTTGEVILRGAGFQPTTTVAFGPTAATSVIYTSDSELRATYSPRAAGTYPVILNAGSKPFNGELIVADIPQFSASTIPQPATGAIVRSIVYDAERKALILLQVPFVNFAPTNIVRYAYTPGGWTLDQSMNAPEIPRQIMLSPNGSRLLLLTGKEQGTGNDSVIELDPVTLQTSTTTALQFSQGGVARTFAILNDGNALLSTRFAGSGATNAYLYALQSRQLFVTNYQTDMGVASSSNDGSIGLIQSTGLARYDASNGQFAIDTTTQISFGEDFVNNPTPPSVSRNGGRILAGPAVFDRNAKLLAQLDIAPQMMGVINLQGTRAYTVDANYVLHTFDISGSTVSGKYAESGLPITITNGSTTVGNVYRMIMAPDDKTIFLAGFFGIRIQPVP